MANHSCSDSCDTLWATLDCVSCFEFMCTPSQSALKQPDNGIGRNKTRKSLIHQRKMPGPQNSVYLHHQMPEATRSSLFVIQHIFLTIPQFFYNTQGLHF